MADTLDSKFDWILNQELVYQSLPLVPVWVLVTGDWVEESARWDDSETWDENI